MRRTRADLVFDIINISFMVLLLVIMIYPIYFIIIASISEPRFVATGGVILFPKGISFDAYTNVFNNKTIWMGYRNAIYYTTTGTFLNIILTLPTAYVLSKKQLRGKVFFSWYFLFTMFFGGGLIPTYLLVRDLGLLNKPYTLIVLGGLSVYLMIITRVYYQTTIPNELFEAAIVDGCSDFGQFFKIALPLSMPIIAVMSLFYAVGRWNEFMTALIYLSDSRFYPLQLVLRNILIKGQTFLESLQMTGIQDEDALKMALKQAQLAEAMKYSLIFIASAPLLAAYPFVQKHFVKGIMIGSLKG